MQQRFNIISPKRTKKIKMPTFEQGLGIPYYIILIVFIVLPMFILLLYSFSSNARGGFKISFTLSNYRAVVLEMANLKTMGRSLLISGIATIVTLLIGYPLAFFIANCKQKTQAMLILAVNAPMWINMLLRVRALEQVLRMFSESFYRTNAAVVIGMVYVFLPFMVLPIYTILSKMDKNLYESSADLGANKFKTFIRVTLPLSLSGVLSGIIMVFLPAATTLVVPKYLGPDVYMIGNIIENSIVKQLYGGYGYGAAVSIILAIIILLMVVLMKKADRYQEVGEDGKR